MSIVPSPPRAHQSPAVLCRASVLQDAYGNRELEVISPRTGRKLRIGAGWWNELPDSRLIGRVASAQSIGRKVEFTRSELHALAALAEKIDKHLNQRLPRGGGWSGSWSVK